MGIDKKNMGERSRVLAWRASAGLLALGCLACLATREARAVPLPVTIHVSDGTNTADFQPDGTIDANRVFASDGAYATPTWSLTWHTTGGAPGGGNFPGGGFFSYFIITNLTEQEQTFAALLTLPMYPFSGGSFVGGRLQFIGVGDLNQDGFQLLSTNDELGRPLLAAQIDGVDFATLGDSPYSTTTRIDSFVGFPDDVGSAQIPAAPIQTSIGIRSDFRVSAGDVVAFAAGFQAVPEPASAVLAMLALVPIAALRLGCWG